MSIRKLRISSRMLLIVAAAVMGMTTVAAISLDRLYTILLHDREDKARQLVETAYGILTTFEARTHTGSLSEGEAKSQALAILAPLRSSDDDYFFVTDLRPIMLMHPTTELVGKDVAETRDSNGKAMFMEMVKLVQTQGSGFVSYLWPKPGYDRPVPKISYAKGFLPWGWVIGTGIYLDDVDTIFHDQALLLGTIVVGVMALVVSLSLLVSRGIVRPVREMTEAMARLAQGDHDVVIPDHRGTDEIGAMSRAMAVFKSNAAEMHRLALEQAQIKSEAAEARRQERRRLADAFEDKARSMIDLVRSNSNKIVATAGKMGKKVGISSDQSMDAAAVSRRTVDSIRALTDATQYLSESFANVCRRVSESNAISQQAVTQAESTNRQVDGLSESAERIGQVVNLISSIASQTNLLALNATIEAARAGEAGKGFAVVATEVKNLAGQTAKATEEISSQVAAIQEATRSAAQAIGNISRIIANMSDIANDVATSVARQDGATADILTRVRNIAQDAEIFTNRFSTVARTSASSYASAIKVIWTANDLSKPTDTLILEVGALMQALRS